MAPSPTQVVVAITILFVFGAFWYAVGRGRWRAALEDRFVYGIPWGTAITVAIVVAFYLFAQSGLWHWNDPVVFAFVSWSYFYPLGMATAGIAHGSPAHLIGNMAGTLALAPIAEYAWSHYPRSVGSESGGDTPTNDGGGTGSGGGTDDASDSEWEADDELLPDGYGDDGDRSLLGHPWFRAVVVFPAVLLAAALVTSIYSLGPGLGFSGAVYAIIGFAVVYYPLKTVVAVVAASALGALWDALANPIVRGTIESGAPAPPSWAGVGWQAHALGFLLGVVVALALLSSRGRRPSAERVFFGVVLVGLVQSLWLVVWPGGDDVFFLYRGAGVVAFLVVAGLVTLAVSRRDVGGLFTKGNAAIGALVVLAVLLALPSLFLGIVVVDDGGGPDAEGVEIQDYTVTYADNATSGHAPGIDLGDEELYASEQTGVVVISEDREIWTPAVRDEVLEHQGNATVTVGGTAWHETVRAQRVGWDVAGNDTAFVVDLHHDGETTRSFTSEPMTAGARIDGHSATFVPTEDDFEVRVGEGSNAVDTIPIPPTNSSSSVGPVEIRTESDGDVRRVYLVTDDSRALVATEETYS